MTKRDYYEILNIPRTAFEADIKRSYRQLAKQYHPDLNPQNHEAEEKFKEASEAYEVLHDPEKRRIYDQFGHEGLEGRGFHGFSGVEDIFSSFGDVFDSFFGFGSSRSRRTSSIAGADLQVELRISFRDAIFGCKRELDVEREIACTECHESGVESGHKVETCPTCKGRGQVHHARGFLSIATTCPRCRGTGKFITHPCKKCKGTGRAIEKKKVEVAIPAGVDHEMHIRLTGEGEGGVRGGPFGDLYIKLSISKDPVFRREGEHLYSIIEIGMAQAVLGAEVEIQTIDGQEKVEIPKGTQSGDLITLNEKGVPKLHKQARGNHYLEVRVTIPTRLTKHQEELLRKFAEESGEKVLPAKEGFLRKLRKGKDQE